MGLPVNCKELAWKQERGQPGPRELDLKPGTRGHGRPPTNLRIQDSGEKPWSGLASWQRWADPALDRRIYQHPVLLNSISDAGQTRY